MRRRLIEHQDERLTRIEAFDVRGLLAKALGDHGHRRPTLQLQGPFETSYSLAATNRALATGLARSGLFDVSIYATEGPGDYTPADADLAAHPESTALYDARGSAPFPDVVIRQMFPPRVDDSPGGMTFQYFAWEESRVPPEYVADFNRHLDGIGATSRFVADVLRDSGVVVPITVVRNGVVEPPRGSIDGVEELRDLRGFRFVHISSAFPRKGVDLLLGAYFDAFTGDDDVTLVLKTHPNPHNVAGDQLAALRAAHPNPPDVRWIDRDLEPEQVGAAVLARRQLRPPCAAGRASGCQSRRRCSPRCR